MFNTKKLTAADLRFLHEVVWPHVKKAFELCDARGIPFLAVAGGDNQDGAQAYLMLAHAHIPEAPPMLMAAGAAVQGEYTVAAAALLVAKASTQAVTEHDGTDADAFIASVGQPAPNAPAPTTEQ